MGHEFHKLVTGWQLVAHNGVGVRANAEGHGEAIELHRVAAAILVQLHRAKAGRGGLPFQVRELGAFTGGVDQFRLSPVRPVAGITVAAVRHHEVQFLGTGNLGDQLGGAGFLGDHLGFGDRLGPGDFACSLRAGIAPGLGPAAFVVQVRV